jgi:hypothetical protein
VAIGTAFSSSYSEALQKGPVKAGKRKGKMLLCRTCHRWEGHIEIDLQEAACRISIGFIWLNIGINKQTKKQTPWP